MTQLDVRQRVGVPSRPSGQAMNWNLSPSVRAFLRAPPRTWRARLRITSGLVMLAFVICHLTAHCFLLVSFEDAEAVRNVLMYPWRTYQDIADCFGVLEGHQQEAMRG